MGLYKEGFYFVFKVEERVKVDREKDIEFHEVCIHPKPLRVWRDSDGKYWHKKKQIEVADNENSLLCSYNTEIGSSVFKGLSFATSEAYYTRHFMKHQEDLLRIFKGYGKEPVVLPRDSEKGRKIINHLGGNIPMIRSRGGKSL